MSMKRYLVNQKVIQQYGPFVEQKSSNTGLLIKLFYKLSIFIINEQTFLLIIKLCFKAT